MPTNNPNQHTSQPTPRGAAEAAGNRIEQGGKRVEGTIERLEKTAEEAASSAIDRVRAAREQATSGIVQQRDQVAQRLQKVGDVLRSGSEYLRTDDPLAYQLLTYASERAEGIASYVRGATPGGLADDLHTFAKRRPGVFFGGAFLLGLAVGRFVKSSTSPTGGDRNDAAGYGDVDLDFDDDMPARELGSASTRARPTPASAESGYGAQQTSYGAQQTGTGSASTGSAGTGTSLPYVSAGKGAMGSSTPTSSTYGASTASGTSGATEGAKPSYGSTAGGTGGYASQQGGSTPMVTRPSQQPLAKEAADTPPNPKAHAVREGEGSKS